MVAHQHVDDALAQAYRVVVDGAADQASRGLLMIGADFVVGHINLRLSYESVGCRRLPRAAWTTQRYNIGESEPYIGGCGRYFRH